MLTSEQWKVCLLYLFMLSYQLLLFFCKDENVSLISLIHISFKVKKCDLVSLYEELDSDILLNSTVTRLIKLIKESDDFNEDFANLS